MPVIAAAQTRDWLDRGQMLEEAHHLFIVHVSSPKGSGNSKKSDWKAGGALAHSLEVTLLFLDRLFLHSSRLPEWLRIMAFTCVAL